MTPRKLPTPCNYPNCPNLTHDRYCDEHKGQADAHRGTAAERGYDARWRKYRKWFLKRNPLCVECLKEGRTEPATVVDHVTPHRGDMELFWDTSNHAALCLSHHNAKSARERKG